MSIQAEARKRGKSIGAYLNDKTKKSAYNMGAPWSDDDVATIVNMREHGDTVFDMAIRLGRTYYSAMTASSHIGFAMRHWDTLEGLLG